MFKHVSFSANFLSFTGEMIFFKYSNLAGDKTHNVSDWYIQQTATETQLKYKSGTQKRKLFDKGD